MNKLLMSSIIGSEFINYRKKTSYSHRNNFSIRTRSNGDGLIPIVVDSVNYELSMLLSADENNMRSKRSCGKEYIMHIDITVDQFLNQINEDVINKDIINKVNKVNKVNKITNNTLFKENVFKLGLEDGSLLDPALTLGYLYKNHKYHKDNILYMLLTKEVTMYGYIMSIIRYVFYNKK